MERNELKRNKLGKYRKKKREKKTLKTLPSNKWFFPVCVASPHLKGFFKAPHLWKVIWL